MSTIFSATILIAFGLWAANSEQQTVIRNGDWVVTDHETVADQHIVLNGSLILEKGGQLTLRNCHLEIIGEKSREHIVDWRGGKLVTLKTVLGGTDRTGTAVHTVFHLYDGIWEAEDTTVEFSYGISFSDTARGILRAKRLRAGRRPDAVIASGLADITLEDSVFPVALGIYTHQGGDVTLALPSNRPLDASFDSTNLTPGVKWKLTLVRTEVPQWFVFLRNIGPSNPPCVVTLQEADDTIISLLGHNLAGDIFLTPNLAEPLRVGSLTLKRGSAEIRVPMWALYFSGDKTDVNIRGKTHICELMVRAGKVRFAGDNLSELSIGCTTLELSGNAYLELKNVHLGRPLNWRGESSEMGEINAVDNAVLMAENVTMRNLLLHAKDRAHMTFKAARTYGRIDTRKEGGVIEIDTLGTGGP